MKSFIKLLLILIFTFISASSNSEEIIQIKPDFLTQTAIIKAEQYTRETSIACSNSYNVPLISHRQDKNLLPLISYGKLSKNNLILTLLSKSNHRLINIGYADLTDTYLNNEICTRAP